MDSCCCMSCPSHRQNSEWKEEVTRHTSQEKAYYHIEHHPSSDPHDLNHEQDQDWCIFLHITVQPLWAHIHNQLLSAGCDRYLVIGLWCKTCCLCLSQHIYLHWYTHFHSWSMVLKSNCTSSWRKKQFELQLKCQTSSPIWQVNQLCTVHSLAYVSFYETIWMMF